MRHSLPLVEEPAGVIEGFWSRPPTFPHSIAAIARQAIIRRWIALIT